MSSFNLLLALILEFAKIGLFAVGGGMAAVPFLAEISEKYGWFTLEKLSTMIAVSESTPGPIGINMATYVGFDMFGLLGALLATLAIATPSLIIVCIVANYLERFRQTKVVNQLFAGLKPAVVALIISACASLFVSTFFNGDQYIDLSHLNIHSTILFVVLLLLSNINKKIHPIMLIIIAAIAGIVIS